MTGQELVNEIRNLGNLADSIEKDTLRLQRGGLHRASQALTEANLYVKRAIGSVQEAAGTQLLDEALRTTR